MASYWRSPYREYSNSFRSPDHSTLKFEQSLYLSRSRTSITSSKYDWLDAAFGSPTYNTYRQPDLTRSNTNIKSILKPSKRESSLFRGKQSDSNSSGESNDVNGDSTKRDNVKKKVTFGFSKDVEDDNDPNDSLYSQNKKFQQKTIKRLSHSRLLEESAMKKLNRLIGGAGAIFDSTSLPSVKGTGILSPRHSAENKLQKSACSHSADLRCIKCIRKDVENSHDDRLHGKASIKEKPIPKPNATLPSRDNVIDSEINNFTERLEGNTTEWFTRDQMSKDNEENNHNETIQFNREDTSNRLGNNSTTTSASNSSKKHVRLLPGRYPFMTGAMQIKKLSIPDIQRAQRGDAGVTKENTNLVDLKHDKPTAQLHDDKGNNELLQRMSSRGATKTNTNNTRSSSANIRIPAVMPSVALPAAGVNNESGAIKTGKGNNKENGQNDNGEDCNKERKFSSDKTSEIIDWLNDVHQKQAFKPRSSRIYASES